MFIHSVSNMTITEIFYANRLRNSPVGIETHRKNRERWAVVLKVKGETVYTVGDKKVISDSLHPVILPKGCNYSWKCIKPGECIIIEFDADISENDFSSFEIKDNSFIINYFLRIEKCLNLKKPYYKLECNCYLYEIILFLLKSMKSEYTHPRKTYALKPAIDYINVNYYDSKITNDTLAELCQMSNVYFRKTFVTVYSVPPIKYLHNFRIEKAKGILLSDYESVEQVALSVGYNSIYHFSKMFKAYTGKSPTEYAKQKKEKIL